MPCQGGPAGGAEGVPACLYSQFVESLYKGETRQSVQGQIRNSDPFEDGNIQSIVSCDDPQCTAEVESVRWMFEDADAGDFTVASIVAAGFVCRQRRAPR